MSKALAELLGTFMLTLTIPLAEYGVGDLAPLAVGFMLCSMCFTFGYISEAHFNPVFSFAAFLNRRMAFQKLVLFMVAQLLGSFFAGLYGIALAEVDFPVPSSDLATLTGWQTLLCEIAFSFVLSTVMLHMCYSAHRHNDFYGFAVSFALISACLCMGGAASGAFNPAVTTGIQVVACFNGVCKPLFWCWIYWVGPLIGAFCATALYQALDVKESESIEEALQRHAVY